MYDSYIYLSYVATFGSLAVLIGVSFKQLKQARRLAALLAETP
jgi:heme exporter protein D